MQSYYFIYIENVVVGECLVILYYLFICMYDSEELIFYILILLNVQGNEAALPKGCYYIK